MQVLSKCVMRRPNYWYPNRQKLIVLSNALQASEFLTREQANVISERMGVLFPTEIILEALAVFIPSAENTPGRMNEFIFGDIQGQEEAPSASAF